MSLLIMKPEGVGRYSMVHTLGNFQEEQRSIYLLQHQEEGTDNGILPSHPGPKLLCNLALERFPIVSPSAIFTPSPPSSSLG
jgi:hypothetical protein